MTTYVDTSAALKLLIEEAESAELSRYLDGLVGEPLVSSMLLFTELHCAARRRAALDPTSVTAVLDAIHLVDLDRADLLRAGTSGWGLRSADALHLATALRVEADSMVTYDRELADAAASAGLHVVAPR